MANHKSAKKRIRQTEKRRIHNRNIRSAVRSSIKKVHSAVEAGELDAAREAVKLAEKKIAQASAKGAYHKKNASRKISRLHQAIGRASAA